MSTEPTPLRSTSRDPGWRSQAVCRDSDPELFFPTADSGPARADQVAAAKAVCARCPVRAECLAEALARIPYGIAGGLTEHERRQLRTNHRHRSSARSAHGTSGPARTLGHTDPAGPSRSAEGGEHGGNRLPSRISHPTNPLAGTRAAEGHRG